MAIPASLQKGLKLPAIAAPMFLVSGPDLVVETCNAGVIGTFPSLNQRTTEGYREWLHDIKARLHPDAAAYGVNHQLDAPFYVAEIKDGQEIIRARCTTAGCQ